jgi:hypothetical protein
MSTEESGITIIPEADQCTIQFRDIHFSVAMKGKEKKEKVHSSLFLPATDHP